MRKELYDGLNHCIYYPANFYEFMNLLGAKSIRISSDKICEVNKTWDIPSLNITVDYIHSRRLNKAAVIAIGAEEGISAIEKQLAAEAEKLRDR